MSFFGLREHIGNHAHRKACYAPLRGFGLDGGRASRCPAVKPNERQRVAEAAASHDGGSSPKAAGTKKKGEILMMTPEVPLWEKYTMTIEEAARYFRIGEGKIRRLAGEMPTPDWVILNGNRIQVKRRKFEQFIDATDAI